MTIKQKKARDNFKKVIAEAKKLRQKDKKLTQPQAIKKAWAIFSKKKISGSEKHTDTKSHNVRIKVVSGFDMYKVRDRLEYDIRKFIQERDQLKDKLHDPNKFINKAERIFLKRMIAHNNKLIASAKKQLTEHNRLIKQLLK